MKLLLLSAVLWLLHSVAVAGSSCILRSCSDQHVQALRKFSPAITNTSSFRLRAINSSTSDCKKILELYSQDESKTIIGFYIQVCSDDGKGQFDTNHHNMDIQHTTCLNPLDTTVLLPTSFDDSRQYSVFQLTWDAPCRQNYITISYTVLDNYFILQGPIEEKLYILHETQEQHHLKSNNRFKRASAIPDHIAFANRYYIHRLSLDGSQVKTLVSGLQRATAIDFHYRRDYLFWTDTEAKTISRSNLDGSMRTVLLDKGLDQPEGLAVDWVTDKLYWTDRELAIIGVFDLTTTQSRVLISTGTNALPRAIVVDPNTRVMYWTGWNSTAVIEKASMDGDDRTVIHNTSLVEPFALTLDYMTQKLYWIDARNNYLESSNVDGTSRTTIVTSGIYNPFAITTVGDTLYWTDRSVGLRRIKKIGNNNARTFFTNFCELSYGIQAISEQRQQNPDSNPCVNNGGCSHFCLLSSVNSQGYSCSCPDGMDLDTNLLNCALPPENIVANITVQGSCTAAGYSETCCTSGSCFGNPDTCYCDANCHMFGDCCSDVPLDCQSAPKDAYLIFANRHFIHQMSLDGKRVRTAASNLRFAIGIDYHIRENQFYWTDVDQQKIWGSQLDGTQAMTIVETNLISPDDIAIDWLTNKLYWIDIQARIIGVYDLMNGHQANILQTGRGTNPQTIILDPQNRVMYWTDWGDIGAKIEKASMDGNARVEIHNTDLATPIALTLDYQEQILYWGNNDNGLIESSAVDGTNRKRISSALSPWSITVFGDKLYYTDLAAIGIYATNKSGGGGNETLFSALCGEVFGIEVLHASRQVDVPTPCTVYNGGCSHLCLLSSVATSGFSCACPYGMMLNSDQKTCSAINESPLNITSPPMDVITDIMQPIDLSCETEGYPTPSHEWYKDGVLISGEIFPYLYISEAQPSDRGNYTCKAINSNEEVESPPALVNLSGVYQYVATLQLLNQFNRINVLQEAKRINTTTTVMFHSVVLLSTNSSETAALFFTLVENTTPRNVLQMELQAFETAEVITITRYDGCDADLQDGYSWPETNLATAVIIPCPCEELLGSLAGIIGVRYCGGTFSNGASWNEIDYEFEDCAVATSATTRALCSISGTAEDVSQQVMNITEMEELVTTDIAAVVSIIEQFNLTDQATLNTKVQNNYLQIIDNIQQANKSAVLESQLETQSSSRMLESLGRFLDNVDTSNDTNHTLLTFQTFALQAQDIDPNDFHGQTFNVDLGSVEEALQMNDAINETRLITSDMVMAALTNATAAVQVPQTLFEGVDINRSEDISSSQRLSYFVFLSDVLFQTDNPNTTIGSIIIGVQLNSILNISLSLPPLTFTFQTNNKLAQNATNSSCATWDSSYNSGKKCTMQYWDSGFGSWSTSDSESIDSRRMCSYRQLAITQAHFGILFDLSPQPPIIGLALSIISYIGVVISLVCLTAFILTYISSKKLRTSIHGQILINLSIALMGLYIMFVVGAFAVPIAAICGISSALIHYFILVFFGWTAVEAVWLYLKIVRVLGIQKYEVNFILKAGIPTWLIPLLIVILSSGAGYKYYFNGFYCRPTQWPFFFGLILPFVVVYAFNWVMYILILVSFCRHVKRSSNGKKTDKKQVKKFCHNIVVAITLAVVLGLGWGFGLLATSHSVQVLSTIFQIIFAIFVGLQGVFIFVLHGVRNPDARKLWKNVLCAKTSTRHITRPTITSHVEKQPSISTDLARSTLPRQMETRVFDGENNVEMEAYGNLHRATNTNTSSLSYLDPNSARLHATAKYNIEPLAHRNAASTTHSADPPPSTQTGRGKRRRSLPQLTGKRISRRAFSYSDLEVYWQGDGLRKALSFSDLEKSH